MQNSLFEEMNNNIYNNNITYLSSNHIKKKIYIQFNNDCYVTIINYKLRIITK